MPFNNAPNAFPPTIAGNSEFSTNYTNFMEVKNFTDGVLVIDDGYIHNLKDPIENRDAANKQYVLDNATGDSGSLKTWKNAVNAASTANISLSGIQTVDGVLLSIDYRVLVKDQNVPSENGIYLVSESAWSRSIDASDSPPVQASGTAIYVLAGTANAGKVYTCDTISSGPDFEPVYYGSDITFEPFGQSTPGGSNTQVQYNNNGVLDGDSGLIWTGTILEATSIESNSLQALTSSDANIYTDHEAPLIIGNIVSPTISTTLLTNSGSISMGNQTNNKLSIIGTNRVSGTGSSLILTAGSGSLGGSLYISTGSSSAGNGPPVVIRPGSGSGSQGNVIINPVSPTESVSSSSGSLVVFGGLGVTGSIITSGTLSGTQLLPNGRIFVGSSTGISSPVVMSGDVSIVNTGITTLATVITAGTFSSANITVDAKGRVISASNGSSSGSAPGGTTNSIQYNAGAGSLGGLINFSSSLGSNLVGNTSSELYIGNSSNLTGSIGPLSVAGSAFIGRSLIIGETLGAKMPLTSGQILVGSSTNLATNAIMTGDASISNTGILSLASIITAGTYTNANISVDATGRIRVASNGSGGSGTPAGSTGAIQFNNAGSFGGTSRWSYNSSSNSITSTGISSLVLQGTDLRSVTIGGTSEMIGISLDILGNMYNRGTVYIQNTGSSSAMIVDGQIQLSNNYNSTSPAMIISSGGLYINNQGALDKGSMEVYGTSAIEYLQIIGDDNSTDYENGSLIISGNGGIGVGGNINANGSISTNGTLSGNLILGPNLFYQGNAQSIAIGATMNGDATLGSAGALTLASVTTAGTYSNASIEIDEKGRVLSASSGTFGGTNGSAIFNDNGVLNGDSSWIYGTFASIFPSLAGDYFASTGGSALSLGGTINVFGNVISMGTAGGAVFGGSVFVTSTTASIDSSTGALIVEGGAGIKKDLFVGGNITCVALSETSDARLKENIECLTSIKASDMLDNLHGYKYNLIGDSKISTKYGLMAQDLIDTDLECLVNTNSTGYYSINYSGIIPILVESIKELKHEIKELKSNLYQL